MTIDYSRFRSPLPAKSQRPLPLMASSFADNAEITAVMLTKMDVVSLSRFTTLRTLFDSAP